MKLFKSDLYRSLAIGFAIGALIVGVQAVPDTLAIAAPAADAPLVGAIAR